MDNQTIINAISTIGFPIVMCLILVFVIYKSNENHKEEMNSLKESINTLKEQIIAQNNILNTILTLMKGND